MSISIAMFTLVLQFCSSTHSADVSTCFKQYVTCIESKRNFSASQYMLEDEAFLKCYKELH